MKSSAFLIPLFFVLFFTFEGCKPKTVGDSFANYIEEEFDHRVAGTYWVLDLSGCGACNESTLTLLLNDSTKSDSVKLVLTGTPKQVSYYSEKLQRYRIFADTDRKIYAAMNEIESFKLPMKIKY